MGTKTSVSKFFHANEATEHFCQTLHARLLHPLVVVVVVFNLQRDVHGGEVGAGASRDQIQTKVVACKAPITKRGFIDIIISFTGIIMYYLVTHFPELCIMYNLGFFSSMNND